MDEVEFHNACVEMNAQDRWEREHEFDDYHTDDDDLVLDLDEEEGAE